MFRVCHAFLSIHCSLVVTCLERASLLALLCVMFYCVLSLSRVVFLGQMRYLIVSLSDLCLHTYFEIIHFVKTNLRKKGGVLCVFCSSRWYLGNQSYFDAEKTVIDSEFQYFYSDKSSRVLYCKTSGCRTTTTGCSKQRSSPVWPRETTL